VRLALADDPPRLIEFGGPDLLTRNQAVEVFERALGKPCADVYPATWDDGSCATSASNRDPSTPTPAP
jgi:hypothetical protein